MWPGGSSVPTTPWSGSVGWRVIPSHCSHFYIFKWTDSHPKWVNFVAHNPWSSVLNFTNYFTPLCADRCIPFTFPVSCPICGEKGKLDLLPRSGMRIFVSLKGTLSVISYLQGWIKHYIIVGHFDLNDATPLCHACGEVMELISSHDVVREGYWPGSAWPMNSIN